jgi:SAM-dependent methyltransferase
MGVKRYTGVDPRVDPDQKKSKNLRTRRWEDFGWTGRQIMAAMPRIRLVSGGVEELPSVERFDVVVLHNVTEHLMELESVIEEASRRLKPNGILLYNHHNFFAWNGHHMAPKRVSEIDSSDPEQKDYVDWAHLDFDAPEGHYFRRGLNRIRLHELWELTEKYFDILEWTCKASSSEQGADRLTEEIRARHPDLDDEDFLTQNVFVRASPKTR